MVSNSIAVAGLFTGIGGLNSNNLATGVKSLSADGSTVVGTSLNTSLYFEAFRWDRNRQIEGLGSLANARPFSEAHGVSADGSVVIGQSSSRVTIISAKGFYWTESGSIKHIPDLPGGTYAGWANAIDDSGVYIVGFDSNTDSEPDNGFAAYRWNRITSTFDTIGDLPGGRYLSRAEGISGDGATVVGFSTSSNGSEAFRWTAIEGIRGLGDLAGGAFDSVANYASYSGDVIVGYGQSASGTEAFRWTQSEGMMGLGDLSGGGFGSYARCVSADGSLIGGIGTTAAGNEAFLWDAVHGMRRMSDVLTLAGLNTTGWTLSSIEGISANGMIFAGEGINPDGRTEGWYAEITSIPEPRSSSLLLVVTAVALGRRQFRWSIALLKTS